MDAFSGDGLLGGGGTDVKTYAWARGGSDGLLVEVTDGLTGGRGGRVVLGRDGRFSEGRPGMRREDEWIDPTAVWTDANIERKHDFLVSSSVHLIDHTVGTKLSIIQLKQLCR